MNQSIEHDGRKITSEKFTITIPKSWRDSFNLSPGDILTPYYTDGSPLIFLPSGTEPTQLQEVLMDLLIIGPTPEAGRKLIERLEKAKEYLEAAGVAST